MAETVTLKQVAIRAGVSIGTASRVLNGFDGIAPDRVQNVRRAVDELGYRKSSAAQALVSRKRGSLVQTGNIGLVFAGMSSSWLGHATVVSYMMGVEQACRERGFNAIMELTDKLEDVPNCVHEGKVDGVLLKMRTNLGGLVGRLPVGLPMVGLSSADPSVPIAQVMPDNQTAGAMVTEYLWDHGHRRIGFVCHEPRHRQFIPRYQGYEGALRVKGAFDPALVWWGQHDDTGGDTQLAFPDGATAVTAFLKLPKDRRPTAVIAANDWTAGGLYHALSDAGLRVPEDVSVVGFDNYVAACCSLRPNLTSYSVPFRETGYAAGVLLLEKINDERKRAVNHVQLVRGALVERQSVKTMPA